MADSLKFGTSGLRGLASELTGTATRRYVAAFLAHLRADEPEVLGLLALLLFSESRRPSRRGPDGSLVVLGQQDRARWNHDLIDEAQALVRRCIRFGQPGPYQLQAAINAVHADARTVEQTDWTRIARLPDPPAAWQSLHRAGRIGGSRTSRPSADDLAPATSAGASSHTRAPAQPS